MRLHQQSSDGGVAPSLFTNQRIISVGLTSKSRPTNPEIPNAWCWLRGVENKPERLGAPMQILDHALAVPGLVERRTRIDVLHSMAHGVIEQNCDLARRGGHL